MSEARAIIFPSRGRGVDALRVTVRLFASYREKAGTAEVEFGLPDGATVSDLAEEVRRRYPTLTRDAARLVVAVNQEYQDHDYPLSDGDEVALIPPVSGGASSRPPATSASMLTPRLHAPL